MFRLLIWRSPDSEIEILNNTSPKQLPNPLLPTKPFSMESKSHFNPEMYSRLLASQYFCYYVRKNVFLQELRLIVLSNLIVYLISSIPYTLRFIIMGHPPFVAQLGTQCFKFNKLFILTPCHIAKAIHFFLYCQNIFFHGHKNSFFHILRLAGSFFLHTFEIGFYNIPQRLSMRFRS
uniref:Uncharacterized protein n=1 Tax=Heterorhabditis bacteriophora TaxID=37862 RepID=A0A1I7W9C4_HETBA